jgi:hypothetical protein
MAPAPEKCDNCAARPATKLILDSKEREVAEVCDECVRYYMRTVVPL